MKLARFVNFLKGLADRYGSMHVQIYPDFLLANQTAI